MVVVKVGGLVPPGLLKLRRWTGAHKAPVGHGALDVEEMGIHCSFGLPGIRNPMTDLGDSATSAEVSMTMPGSFLKVSEVGTCTSKTGLTAPTCSIRS